MKIAVIGCGNLGKSLVRGMIESGNFQASDIYATRRNPQLLEDLAFVGVNVGKDNKHAVQQADVVILAVKPYNLADILAEIHPELKADKHILVSVATSVTLAEIKEAAQVHALSIFRAMPNTAADIRESITCICQNEFAQAHTSKVEEVFRTLGPVLHIDENLMEAATILGACGIAYVMRFIRAMVQGGIQIGFSARIANAIVEQTVKGAAELLIQRGEHPETEIDKVTTPKGCTIVGLNEMEHNGFSSSLIKGIVASYEKIAPE